MSLVRRTILLNALVVTGAFLVLVISPVALVAPFAVWELTVLALVLMVLLVVTSWGIVRSLAPLRTLQHEIALLDDLDEQHRLPETGAREVVAVARSFNGLLDRLARAARERTRHELAAQEAERLRIARELHDDIGQTLTFSLMSLANVAADHPDLRRELEQPRESLRSGLEEVRSIAAALRPGVLDDLGLRAALDDLTSRAARDSGLQVIRELVVPDDLTAEQELVIFRVGQEALTNAVRHAAALTLTVRLETTCDVVVLTVTDDGIGYEDGRGAGIEGMTERARLVKGTLCIEHAPGGGTVVRLTVPREG